MWFHRRMKSYLIPAILLISVILFHPGTVRAESSEEYIMYYLIEETGMTPAAACGVLANIDCESRFQTNAVSPTNAYGLCQWTNPRYARLVSYCSSNGYSLDSVEGQAGFIVYELNSYFPDVLSYLCSLGNDAGSAYAAGYKWCLNYEGSGSSSLSAYRGGIASSEFWPNYGANAFYLTVSNGGSGVKLSWPKGNGKKYVIKRSEKRNKGYKTIATLDGGKCSYTDKSAKSGKRYYYYVTAYNKKGKKIRSTNRADVVALRSLGSEKCKVTLSKRTYIYSGRAKKPAVTVYYNGKKLKKNKDYTVTYENNINAGTAKVIIRGIGKYAGVARKTFTIGKAERKITVKDVTVTWAKKMKKATLQVKVKGGSSKDLKITFSGGKVAKLRQRKIEFLGCGVATGTASLKGDKNHKGVRVTFTVTVCPGKQTIKSASAAGKNTVSLSWKKDKKASGYQIAYTEVGKTDQKTDPKTVYKTVDGWKTNKTSLTGLREKTTYRISIRSFAGKGKKTAYGKWSGTVTITVP